MRNKLFDKCRKIKTSIWMLALYSQQINCTLITLLICRTNVRPPGRINNLPNVELNPYLNSDISDHQLVWRRPLLEHSPVGLLIGFGRNFYKNLSLVKGVPMSRKRFCGFIDIADTECSNLLDLHPTKSRRVWILGKNMPKMDPIIEYYFVNKSTKLLLEAITEPYDT